MTEVAAAVMASAPAPASGSARSADRWERPGRKPHDRAGLPFAGSEPARQRAGDRLTTAPGVI
jgi:hypothetical protein